MAKSQGEDITASILVVGDEVLSGRTRDANIHEIAQVCTQGGIDLREVRIVADDRDDIIVALNALRARFTYVFTTGGIGPTHDDITADAVAGAFKVDLVESDDALLMMAQKYGNSEITPARARMARIPDGASLIANSVSGAPGFKIENVYVMAGVPVIMRAMLESIAPTLKGGKILHSRTIEVGVGESVIARGLGEVQDLYPDVKIGSYPRMGEKPVYTEVVLRGADLALLDEATQKVQIIVDDAHQANGVNLNRTKS